MTTTIFVDDDAKGRMAGWFDTFRSTLPFETETRFVDTPEGRTHVLVAGPVDAPPLVCLHGALATSAHVLPELGSLVERYRIYAIDVMGQSVMSADRRIDVRDDSYGTWLAGVCRGLGLTKVILFGVSWGGFVALRTAKVAPDLIEALILLVPAGVVSGSAWAGFTRVGWPMLTYRLSPSEKRLRRLVDAMFTTYDERWTKYFGEAVRSYRFDMRIPPLAKLEDLASYKGPTLVLGADGDVSFPGAALIARAKELFPHAEVGLLEGCKHCPPVEDDFRAKTATRIQAFLEGARGQK
jgi:pimeloyl-ACP methyl ester carboxylesterase